ncbi:hypothetical protein DXG03_009166 [Asterophora parasitica]|uniref:Uncharacterized protein n=1 Tax=Asterophora parasitica TaxID=117018 RepID=A0A9P7G6I5_9AGAR|nr:hypothetical protein DXG03_009166 [Asterophora parasitica]
MSKSARYRRRSLDDFDYYYRGSPPPAYYSISGPPAPSPRRTYNHRCRSPRHRSPPRFSDEAGMAASHAYSDTWARSEPRRRYKEQYDYASQSLNLNAWNTDYTYEGAVARMAEGASENNQINYPYDTLSLQVITQETAVEKLLPAWEEPQSYPA